MLRCTHWLCEPLSKIAFLYLCDPQTPSEVGEMEHGSLLCFVAWFGLCVKASLFSRRNADAQRPHDSAETTAHPNLCGIDHEALNKQIMEYRRKKERGLQCMSLEPSSEQEQAPDPTRLLRKRKKARSRQHQDASPRSFLLGEEDEDSSTEWECHAHEAEEEWEAELRGDSVKQGLCGKREQG